MWLWLLSLESWLPYSVNNYTLDQSHLPDLFFLLKLAVNFWTGIEVDSVVGFSKTQWKQSLRSQVLWCGLSKILCAKEYPFIMLLFLKTFIKKNWTYYTKLYNKSTCVPIALFLQWSTFGEISFIFMPIHSPPPFYFQANFRYYIILSINISVEHRYSFKQSSLK